MFGSSKEKRFWKWFQRNDDWIFAFEADQDRVFTELGKRLRQVHPDLAFEFGPVQEDGRRKFVVSADGFAKAVPAVEAVVEAAPDLERWIWVSFRQRGGAHVEFSFMDVIINTEKLRFSLSPNGELADVTIHFPDFDREKQAVYEQACFLLLDHLLGEFDVITRVGRVAAVPKSSAGSLERKALCELPAEFDAHIAKQRQSYH